MVLGPAFALAGETPRTAGDPPVLSQAIAHAVATESRIPARALPTTVVGPRGTLGFTATASTAASSQQTDLGSPGFFRTPAGLLTLAAIGVGVGFAIYSTSHDRVKSPAR